MPTRILKSGRIDNRKRVNKAPKGWRKTQGALTAPIGYEWYNNSKSAISGKRKSVLVKEKR